MRSLLSKGLLTVACFLVAIQQANAEWRRDYCNGGYSPSYYGGYGSVYNGGYRGTYRYPITVYPSYGAYYSGSGVYQYNIYPGNPSYYAPPTRNAYSSRPAFTFSTYR
jgi:hypothetical protein